MPFTWAVLASGPGWASPADEGATATVAAREEGAPIRRVAVLRFIGPNAEVIRTAAVDALGEKFTLELVSIGLVETQLDLPTDPLKTVAELAERLRLATVVRGTVVRAGKGMRVTLIVVNGADGAVIGQVSFRAPTVLGLHTKVRTQALIHLDPLIERTMAPRSSRAAEHEEQPDHSSAPSKSPSATPTPSPSSAYPSARPEAESSPAEAADGAPPAPRSPLAAVVAPEAHAPLGAVPIDSERHIDEPPEPGPGHTPGAPARCEMVEFEVDGGVVLRRYNYRDERRGALRAYTLRGALGGRFEGAFYPIGGSRCGRGVAVGLKGAYETMAPITAQLAGRSLETSAFAYQGELVVRISWGALTLKPSAGFFARRFVVKGDVVPSVDYRALGFGVDAALRFHAVSLEGGLGARRILDAGEVTSADWFPRATGMSTAARARVAVVTAWLDFIVGGAVEYVSLQLNANDGEPYPNGVAGGAYDLYFFGYGGLRFRLPSLGQAGSVTTAQ